jgi:hypothetical protein
MTDKQDSPSCDDRQCDEDHYDPEAEWIVTCEAPNEVWGGTYETCSEQCGHGCYYLLVLVPEVEAEHQAEMRAEGL